MTVVNQISGMAIDHLEGLESYGLKWFTNEYISMYLQQFPGEVELLESGHITNYVKESGVWRSQSETSYRIYNETVSEFGYADTCIENRLSIAVMRPASKYVTFEYRGEFNQIAEVDPSTGAQLYLSSSMNVTVRPISQDGIIDFFNYFEVGEESQLIIEPGSGVVDWASITLDLSSMPALPNGSIGHALMFAYQQIGASVGYGKYNFDFSSEWAEFRNIRTAPAKFVMYPILLGSKSHAVSAPASMTLTPSAISYYAGKWNDFPAAVMQFIVNLIGSGVGQSVIDNAAEIMFSASNPAYSWAVPKYQLGLAQIIYTMTLTGSPDVEIPISSFQSVVRQGGATVAEVQAASDLYTEQLSTLNEQYTQGQMTEQEWNTARSEILADLTSRMAELNASRPSYLSCVIPNFVDYIDEILARQDGEVIIKKGYRMPAGYRNMEEIVRGNFEYIMYDRGARSASAQITAYKTKKYYSPVRRTVTGVSYVGMDSQGRRRIRCAMDLFLRPQDICVFGAGINDLMTVGTITYTVSDRSAVMQVTEQDESF